MFHKILVPRFSYPVKVEAAGKDDTGPLLRIFYAHDPDLHVEVNIEEAEALIVALLQWTLTERLAR